jgi:hypothetical protein
MGYRTGKCRDQKEKKKPKIHQNKQVESIIAISRNWCEDAGTLLSAIPRYWPNMLGTGAGYRCEAGNASPFTVVIAVDIRDIRGVLGGPGDRRSLPTMPDVHVLHFAAAAAGGAGCLALVRCDSSPVVGGMNKYFGGGALSSE